MVVCRSENLHFLQPYAVYAKTSVFYAMACDKWDVQKTYWTFHNRERSKCIGVF